MLAWRNTSNKELIISIIIDISKEKQNKLDQILVTGCVIYCFVYCFVVTPWQAAMIGQCPTQPVTEMSILGP